MATWIIKIRQINNVPKSNVNKIHCGLFKDDADLNKLLRGFGKIEICESEPNNNKETLICE